MSRRCTANAETGSTSDCELKPLKRGNWDIWVRSVNAAAPSDWLQGASASIKSCTSVDAQTGSCEVYDKGPGGGLVVYDAGERKPWGRYLEVAPAGWNGSSPDPAVEWCSENASGYGNRLATGSEAGTGPSNTALIINECGQSSAAGKAASYRGGGLDDWYLPPSDEMQYMYNMRSEVGGLTQNTYWTSSQDQSTANDGAPRFAAFVLTMIWRGGSQDGNTAGSVRWATKTDVVGIRPFRAF